MSSIMYKRPQLRPREESRPSSRPQPGSFLYGIVNPPPKQEYTRRKYPIYMKHVYLPLLKRNCDELGIEYKEPDIPDYVPPERPHKPVEPSLPFMDKVYMKVRILKSGIIRIKIDGSFLSLYEKYYSKAKLPPNKTVLQAYKSLGFSESFLEQVKLKFSKFQEHKKKVEQKIDSVFNKEKKEPTKKPKKVKKKVEELIEDDEPVEDEENEEDEVDEDDDPGEDGEMDVEVDEDLEEQVAEDQEEAYLSD